MREDDIPAEKATAQHGARLQKAHEHEKRQKGTAQKAAEGQKGPFGVGFMDPLSKTEAEPGAGSGPASGSRRRALVTLKNTRAFDAVFGGGRSAANRQLVVYYRRNGLNHNRFGFSVGKKVGNSVTRNKVRRRLKEIIRAREKGASASPGQGYDFIFIARGVCAALPYRDLDASVRHVLQKSGLPKHL